MSDIFKPRPTHLDLKRDQGLTITWADGSQSSYTVAELRRMSPSADMRQLREEMARNPLTVLPQAVGSDQPLRIERLERVGRYAVRIVFSDGHDTGIYSWDYLWQLAGKK